MNAAEAKELAVLARWQQESDKEDWNSRFRGIRQALNDRHKAIELIEAQARKGGNKLDIDLEEEGCEGYAAAYKGCLAGFLRARGFEVTLQHNKLSVLWR
jgi:hypothetical protein